jgi:hypothetical protein
LKLDYREAGKKATKHLVKELKDHKRVIDE